MPGPVPGLRDEECLQFDSQADLKPVQSLPASSAPVRKISTGTVLGGLRARREQLQWPGLKAEIRKSFLLLYPLIIGPAFSDLHDDNSTLKLTIKSFIREESRTGFLLKTAENSRKTHHSNVITVIFLKKSIPLIR